jgi:hypothetical protein
MLAGGPQAAAPAGGPSCAQHPTRISCSPRRAAARRPGAHAPTTPEQSAARSRWARLISRIYEDFPLPRSDLEPGNWYPNPTGFYRRRALPPWRRVHARSARLAGQVSRAGALTRPLSNGGCVSGLVRSWLLLLQSRGPTFERMHH